MAVSIPALVAIGTGVLGVSSVAQAIQQNDAAKKAESAQRRAAAVQQDQLRAAADVERTKRIEEQRRISARLRVAAGESGLSLGGGTVNALQFQTESDLETNLGLIDQNLDNQILAVQSGAEANIASLQSSVSNPLFAGLSGAIGGALTGLQLGQGIQSLQEPTLDPANTLALYQPGASA